MQRTPPPDDSVRVIPETAGSRVKVSYNLSKRSDLIGCKIDGR